VQFVWSTLAAILSQNGVSGTLPSSLSTELRTLVVNAEALSGTVPNISNAEAIKLTYRSQILSGTLPASWATSTFLATITLEQSGVSGVIPAFQDSNLIALLADDCKIGGTVPHPENLKRLLHFSMGNTSLSGSIPPDAFDFDLLKTLVVTSNRCSFIPLQAE